jgi:hypothetical protein
VGGEEPSGKTECQHQDGRDQQESQAMLIYEKCHAKYGSLVILQSHSYEI